MLPPTDLHRELRDHASALRTIARDLLRDPHAADDVAQAAMHKALTHRELATGPLGGWLRRVVENFARQWHRGERRRVARESRLGPPEPEPCPTEALMRRESLQAVTNAVLQLDEPYQTAVFLRYFEDLPPRAIAKRTGSSVATVKSRLQRGLALLRQKLDRGGARDDWRRALATAFGLPLAGGSITLTTGALLMGSSTKIAAAVAIVCIGGVCAFHFFDDPKPAAAPPPHATDETKAAAATAAAVAPQPGAERDAAAEAAPTEPWLAHPYLFELDVVVVDRTGAPCEGVTISLGPERVDINDTPVRTGPDGHAIVSWRARQSTGQIVIEDQEGLRRRVPVQHGRRTLISLAGPMPSFGRATAIELDTSRFVLSGVPIVGNVFTTGGIKSTPPGSLQAGLHPHAVFDLAAGIVPPVEQPTPVSEMVIAEGSFALATAFVRTRIDAEISLSARGEAQPAPAIAGTVFGDDGKPLAATPVALLGASPQAIDRTTTDEQGHFEFAGVAAGTFTVRAGGDAAGLGTAPVIVTTGTTPTTVSLRREACVRGRLFADGAPVKEGRVAWRAEDGSWCDETSTTEDGSFVLANLPAMPGDVVAWIPNAGPLPAAVEHHVLTDNGDLVLRAPTATSRRLTIDPEIDDACRAGRMEIVVWQLDTGLGAKMQEGENGKPWHIDNLAPGWYQVELRAGGAGFVDLGRHHLDGTGDVDLGHVVLPLPGRVHFTVPNDVLPEASEQRAFELCQLRTDLDVRVDNADWPLDGSRPMYLPAGNYAFAFRHRDGGVKFVRFTVRAGEETVVTAQ